MTVLVTGGAGFIGSNFIFYLREKYPEERVICLDKLTYAGCIETLSSLKNDENFRFVQGDICDRALVERLFEEEKPEILVHFAAESHVDRSIDQPMVFLETNVLGTGVLLEACRKYGIKRFHQVSTDEVYGDLPLDAKEKFTEESRLRASSPYSSSKAAADLLVLSYYRTYGLPVTISRCSNNYGPYQFPEKLIPLMLVHVKEKMALPVYGNGKQKRNWIYVKDHCDAVDRIVRCGTSGEVYNIASYEEKENIEVVREICRLMGCAEENIEYVEDRKGHDLRYAIDSEKITRELGWKPKTSFSDGLLKTIQWYVQHEDWWKPLYK